MPWKECSVMDQRLEFVLLANQEGVNLAELCRRFGVSRPTAYKWLRRFRLQGQGGLVDRSRRPHGSPCQTSTSVEAAVLAVRDRHPAWGGRKIDRRLHDLRDAGERVILEELVIPSPSTITQILHRHGRIDPKESDKRIAPKRFERARPNDLWQMDFKGDVALANRLVSHPLTVLDDHSRFNLCLRSCLRQTRLKVEGHLTATFRRYGLPYAMLMDNGPPWGTSRTNLTQLALWLLRLGIRVIHGRPYHPQTQGKEERFHRTLKAEVLTGRLFADERALQQALDPWRIVYNHQRPHEALDLNTPASRYRVSPRPFPEAIPPIEYATGEITRRVCRYAGTICFANRTIRISKALGGETVAVRPTHRDGVYWICYGSFAIGELSLHQISPGTHGHARIFPSARSAHLAEYPCKELIIEAD